MKDTGEIPKPETKPGAQRKRLRIRYAPHRNAVRNTFVEEGVDPSHHKRLAARLARQFLEKKEEAERDQLTGLLTRKAFIEQVEQELEIGKEFNTSSTLVILDANGLKQINDKQGHNAGDELLSKIGQQLEEISRATDLVCRWGGDEFAVLLTDTELETSREWWERVNKRFLDNGISISAGSREIFAREIGETSFKEFVADADEQMYLAKDWHRKYGKNFYIGRGPYG